MSGLERNLLKSCKCFTSKQRFKMLPLGISTASHCSFQLFTSFFTVIPFYFSSDVLNRLQLCTTGLDSLLSSKCRLSPELLAFLVIISPPLLLHTHTPIAPSTHFISPLQGWIHVLFSKSSSLRLGWFGKKKNTSSRSSFTPQTGTNWFIAAVWLYLYSSSEF